MADEEDKTRGFGQPEGLGRRLAMWANSLGRNKQYPWLGLGIVDDIRCAARLLGDGEDPNDLYPADVFTHRPALKPAEPAKVEYDL